MTEEKYKERRKEIYDEYRDNLTNLDIFYAKANNPNKIGDTIEDHIGKGKILSQSVYIDREPQMVYECINYNKSGSVSKRIPIRNIYQSNLKKKNYV